MGRWQRSVRCKLFGRPSVLTISERGEIRLRSQSVGSVGPEMKKKASRPFGTRRAVKRGAPPIIKPRRAMAKAAMVKARQAAKETPKKAGKTDLPMNGNQAPEQE